MIDLRSDTVTRPSSEMRAVMASAAVGDDYYRDDPSVNALEEYAAQVMGKEAGLFVPSGTMGNLLAHLAHCSTGGEVIGPAPAHTFNAEVSGLARIAGLSSRLIPQSRGELDLQRFEAAIRPQRIIEPLTALLWVEEPTRGYLVALDDLRGLRAIADRHHLPLHIDGARIFHAATEFGVPVRAIADFADSVMFCLSKGLGAPIGSLLVGDRGFIDRARGHRQLVGGAMRQAGIVASAGLWALQHNVSRLAEDHRNARRLAAGLRQIPGLRVDRDEVETNIFFVEMTEPGWTNRRFSSELEGAGVLANAPANVVRFVTHLDVNTADVDRAIGIARQVLSGAGVAVAG